jgi:hypothetical protein
MRTDLKIAKPRGNSSTDIRAKINKHLPITSLVTGHFST